MKDLPTEEMARIVSQVTQPILGLSFSAADAPLAVIDDAWRTASLPIDGGTPLTVAVSADRDCSRTLGATMFGAPLERVDDAMIDDALCELVNMTAGMLKSALHIDQALGLPKVRERAVLDGCDEAWSQHYLRAGDLNLVLAVATRVL
jgi:hypothetical protein